MSKRARRIQLTQGQYAMVDAADYEWVMTMKWCASRSGCNKRCYAVSGTGRRHRPISLHRFILRAKKGQIIDHIDGNPLNNRRSNLRFCTQAQNIRNSAPRKGKFKGVCWVKGNERWRSQICLGFFKTAEDAARAYNRAAAGLFGEYARLNKIPRARRART